MSGSFWRYLPLALTSASLLVAGAGVSAAAPSKRHVAAKSDSAVVKVHRRHHHHHHHHRYGRGHVVDAPFTRVETGRHVAVDAPFTTVYVGRRGRYVRAPFVELWLPR